MNNHHDIIIRSTTDCRTIYDHLILHGNSLFNKNLNNAFALKKLALKYSQNGCFLMANKGKTNCGVCAFYCNDDTHHIAFLSMIVVEKNFQGSGIGQKLLERMIQICTEHGMKSIRLEVNKNNNNAIDFYKKNRFKKEKEKIDSLYLICDI